MGRGQWRPAMRSGRWAGHLAGHVQFARHHAQPGMAVEPDVARIKIGDEMVGAERAGGNAHRALPEQLDQRRKRKVKFVTV